MINKQKILEILNKESVSENSSNNNRIIIEQDFEIIADEIVKLLTIPVVSNWVAIESDEQPERATYVMVRYKDNEKKVAFFDGDGRFYTVDDDDITDEIIEWHKLP